MATKKKPRKRNRLGLDVRRGILENVRLSARDNARETEGVPFDRVAKEYGPEIQGAYRASVKSICDSLQSPREHGEYAPRLLTAEEAGEIEDELLRQGY